MFVWNSIAKVALLLAICLGFLAYLALASLFGETDCVKGLAFVVGGVAASGCDLAYRFFRRSEDGINRLLSPDWGGSLVVVPMWALGIVGVVGGIGLMFMESHQRK